MRLLLALLAMLTGLSVSGGSAEARACAVGSEAEVSLLEALSCADCAAEAEMAVAPLVLNAAGLAVQSAAEVCQVAVFAPLTVMLKADRARE